MSDRQSAQDRKAQIVVEVLRLADEIGPDRLSTTDVARAIGISQPAIFRHFPTKGALWLAVAEDIADRLQCGLGAAAEAGGPVGAARTPEGADRSATDGPYPEACVCRRSLFSAAELQVENEAAGSTVFRGATCGVSEPPCFAVIRHLQAEGPDLRPLTSGP